VKIANVMMSVTHHVAVRSPFTFTPDRRKKSSGASRPIIVNTASFGGLVPSPDAASYTASKFAVVGLTRTLRMEAKTYGVRVSVLCPGAVRTPILTGGKFGRMQAGVSESRILELVEPLRPLDPAEFARRARAAAGRGVPINLVTGGGKLKGGVDRLTPKLSQHHWSGIRARLPQELGPSPP
jgi:NAD(P)-dependent dehydrogenase (short-subunit alcohol dehydrogenase family)